MIFLNVKENEKIIFLHFNPVGEKHFQLTINTSEKMEIEEIINRIEFTLKGLTNIKENKPNLVILK